MPATPEFVLEVTPAAGGAAERHAIRKDRTLVGRGPGVDVELKGDGVASRFHFWLERDPPRVIDYPSRNGIYVNGQKVTQADLRDGDTIRAGRTMVVFRRTAAAATAAGNGDLSVLAAGAVPPPSSPSLLPPPVVPGYELLDRIGSGGMGEIYRARRRGSKETFAVKLLHTEASDDDTTRKRFLREAACQEQLDHPNIVRFYESGETAGLLYLVMEQVTGSDLHRHVTQHGPMPPERVTRLARQLLDAINFAHVRGVIHRDIKPANILLGADGERLKITDFGLALALSGSRLTLMNQMGGTPQFMAPEQAEDFASASFEADQYAAAAVLYFLLTGQAVFENAPPHVALNLIRTGTPIPLRQPCPVVLPEPLGAVIRRGLKRYTNERFPDARAMRDALGPA